MKSFTYGAMQALDAQTSARETMAKLIHVAHMRGLELEHQWMLDHKMLTMAQPFAWAQDISRAVLSASRSIPMDTELSMENLGTDAIWWHFEEKLPWNTITDEGGAGVRAICMAPVREAKVFPKGAQHDELMRALHGDPAAWEQTVPVYCVSLWIDDNVGLGASPSPSQTFQWRHGESLAGMLQVTAAEHASTYGPNGPWHDRPSIGEDKFLEVTEGIARFLLAGLAWIQQAILVTPDQHIERHERKRLEKELKKRPTLRLVQLRKTQHAYDEDAPEAERRQYSCRFTVDGHWRNQRVGAGRAETKLTWITPYIKGPDDKPLVVSPKKVYVVSR